MTFEYTPEQAAFLARVRDAVERHVAPRARATGEAGPDPAVRVLADLGAWPAPDMVCTVAAIEEVAAASPGVAAALALAGAVNADGDLPGLHGFASRAAAAPDAAVRIALAGLALGIARAALAEALALLKRELPRPRGTDARPHWTVADASTETDAARLLALAAAQRLDRGEPADAHAAMAQLCANAAARQAVDAALRILGPAAYRRGGLLERLDRDRKTAALLTGTEDEPRAVIAAALLPE